MTPTSYEEFLRSKATVAPAIGFEVDAGEVSEILMPHQSAIVRWAVLGGRRAIFAAFGIEDRGRLALELLSKMPADAQVIVYCHLNDEQRGIEKAFA